MRITKAGTKHKTDWDTKDHAVAGHAPVLPPLALAQSNITNAVISLEIAAGCLKRAGKAGAWACVFTALQSLKEAQAAMQEKPKKEVKDEVKP